MQIYLRGTTLGTTFDSTLTLRDMRTTNRKPLTNEELQKMLIEEVAKVGEFVWSDRRKTIEEMLKMRGIKL